MRFVVYHTESGQSFESCGNYHEDFLRDGDIYYISLDGKVCSLKQGVDLTGYNFQIVYDTSEQDIDRDFR